MPLGGKTTWDSYSALMTSHVLPLYLLCIRRIWSAISGNTIRLHTSVSLYLTSFPTQHQEVFFFLINKQKTFFVRIPDRYYRVMCRYQGGVRRAKPLARKGKFMIEPMAQNEDLPSTLTIHQVPETETRSKIDCPINDPDAILQKCSLDAILASTGRSWDDLYSVRGLERSELGGSHGCQGRLWDRFLW